MKDANQGHVKCIKQCGRRTMVTATGIIHDYGPNNTLGENTNDTEGAVMFEIGDRATGPRISASMGRNKDVLDFHAFRWGAGSGEEVYRGKSADMEILGRFSDQNRSRLQFVGNV